MTGRHLVLGVVGVALVVSAWVLLTGNRTSGPNGDLVSAAPGAAGARHSPVAHPSGAASQPGPLTASAPGPELAAGPQRQDVGGQPALYPPAPSELSTQQRPPLANRLGAPGTPPAQEPRIVLDVLDAYRRSFGGYPAGEGNRQFVNALLGANGQKLPFIPADHPRLNAGGELVDAWGTPFFFHLLSRNSIEVRSAGPDRSLFTEDDQVAGTPAPARPKPPTGSTGKG